jgi:hypothetical protein
MGGPVALTKQPVPVPLTGGLDRKTDPKAAPSARLLVCQNARFDLSSTIRKRNGYESLGTTITGVGATYTDAKALTRRGSEPVLLTDGTAYSYQASLGTWNEVGAVASVNSADESVGHTGSNQTQPDHADNGGVRLLAWEDSRGGIYWTLLEVDGGRVLRAPAQADSAGQRPRCLAVGEVLHLVYATAVGELRILVVNPSEPTATVTTAVLTSDLSTTNPSFDAVPTTLTDEPGLIVWAKSTGGYRLGYLSPSGALGSPGNGFDSVVDGTGTVDVGPALGCDNGSAVVVAFYTSSSTTTSAIQHDISDALATTGSTGTIVEAAAVVRLSAVWPASSSTAQVWRELTSASDRDHRTRVASYNGTALAELADMRGAGLASRAFDDNVIAHCWLVHDVTFFAVYLCMQVRDDGTVLCVARSLPGISYGLPDRAHLPSVHVDEEDARIHRWCASWQQQLPAGDEESAVFAEVGIRLVTLDFDSTTAWQTAQLGRNLYIGGACPLRYDGDTIAEAGFHYAPDDVAAPTQGTGGALTLLGTYLYRFVYEEIDAQGEIHQGATSVGTSVTLTGSNNRLTFAIPTYRSGTGKRRVRIGVFRSEQGDSAALYRVSSLDPSAVGSNGYVTNSTSADTVSFVDDMSDAVLITKEPLYTNGGIPSNDPTGAGSILAVGKNRLFYNDPSDPLVVRYTHRLEDGYAAEFSSELTIKVDPYGGAVTALAVMDDRVVIFKRSAIFAVAGAGPLRLPEADPSQGFSDAALVTSDVGCTAPASIASTPNGIVFQSAKGIYLLGRDLSVSYIGALVEAFNSQTVTRATLIEDRRQVVFLCSTGETLMLDYGVGQWSTYTNHTGLDAVVIDGTYHYLRTDGRVFRETVGLYRDDNSQIPMVLETAWIKMVPYLQGFARFYHVHIIGERRSTHTIRFRFQTDFTANWSPPNDVDWTTESGDPYGDGNYGDGVYGGDAPDVFQWSVHLGEVGQSIRFRFEDVEPTGSFGASYEITELLVTGGIKLPAVRPLAAARTR